MQEWKGRLWNEVFKAVIISDTLYLFGREILFLSGKSRNFEKLCLWKPCDQLLLLF